MHEQHVICTCNYCQLTLHCPLVGLSGYGQTPEVRDEITDILETQTRTQTNRNITTLDTTTAESKPTQFNCITVRTG